MIELIAAEPAHIGPIAAGMRQWDVDECAALGRTPRQALRLGLASSFDVRTALLDGVPHAMMGLAPGFAIERKAHPWFLGTEEVYAHGRQMLVMGRQVLADWRDSTLSNVVARENDRAIRLLKRWGFDVGEEVMMIGGLAFLTFSMEG